MSETIGPDNPLWEKLHAIWLSERKPGYVSMGGGEQFRVLLPGDETVLFVKQAGFDQMYGSNSAGSISG